MRASGLRRAFVLYRCIISVAELRRVDDNSATARHAAGREGSAPRGIDPAEFEPVERADVTLEEVRAAHD